MLIEAEVEFYHVDYLAMRKTCYDGDGATVDTPIPLEGFPAREQTPIRCWPGG